jgi:probable HAF family extracellular repeat protein
MRQIALAVAIASAALTPALFATAASAPPRPAYRVTLLSPPSGTSARGVSINDWGFVAGSFKRASGERHAAVWLDGRAWDLGTLGTTAGLKSTVLWPVKNHLGFVSGISQTDAPDPLQEGWSCGVFLSNPGHRLCQGFLWAWGTMRPLASLGSGDHNSFAVGTNDRGQTAGWAENDEHGSDCSGTQVLRFKPVLWEFGRVEPRELPLLGADTAGAATALNNRGQVVGISGECGIAVGGVSAKHAVLWENGGVTELVNPNGAGYWNTPNMINERGDVVGFVGVPGDTDGIYTPPFLWTRGQGFRMLPMLAGDVGGSAQSINNRGQIVGFAYADPNAASHALLWPDGASAAIDLNGLIEPVAGLTLNAANDINDRGEITGTATSASGPIAFVATPIGASAAGSEAEVQAATASGRVGTLTSLMRTEK